MFETLRRAVLFGLGAADMAADKIRQSVDELVARGEMSADEGRKLYDEMTSRVEEQGRSLNDRVKSQVRTMLREMGVADRAQIAMLESRIEALERRLGVYSSEMEGGKREIEDLKDRVKECASMPSVETTEG